MNRRVGANLYVRQGQHRFDIPQLNVRHVLLDEFAVGCHYFTRVDARVDPQKSPARSHTQMLNLCVA